MATITKNELISLNASLSTQLAAAHAQIHQMQGDLLANALTIHELSTKLEATETPVRSFKDLQAHAKRLAISGKFLTRVFAGHVEKFSKESGSWSRA